MATLKLATVLALICGVLLGQVESKALFGIGMRIFGDQLLLKDVLKSRPAFQFQRLTIPFSYAISEPITYIEVLSEKNIYGEVNFGYHNNLVIGSVTGFNTTRFEILIMIYGFNITTPNIDPALILNRDQNVEGMLEPLETGNDTEIDDGYYANEEEHEGEETDLEEYGGLIDDASKTFIDHVGEEGYDLEITEIPDLDFEHVDKIIEVGKRQQGDYLIYETHQTSPTVSQLPTNHTVIFYYIDSAFISYVKFVIFDHYVEKNHQTYVPPVAEYTHFSPHTLKAVITDYETTSLFVRMEMYGYTRSDAPVGFVPFLVKSQPDNAIDATEAPLPPLQRLRMLMKAQQLEQKVTQVEQEPVERSSDGNVMQPSNVAYEPNGGVVLASSNRIGIAVALLVSLLVKSLAMGYC